MAGDIANIGVRFDTSELKEGKAALEAIAPAAQKAETSTEALSKATDNVAVSAAKGTAAIKNEATAMATGAANSNNYAMGVAKAAQANDNLSASAVKVQNATRGLQGQVGNLSAQFSDIAVQLAGGQSPFQIALQQGLQLTGIFGNAGLGAVVRGLGAAFLSLISPLNLITLAVIALGGYAVQYFMNLASGGEQAKLSLDEQNKLIRSIADGWAANIPAVEAYVAALQQAQQAQEAAAASQILTANATKDNKAAIENLNIEFADLLDKLNTVDSTNPVIAELTGAFSNLRTKVAEGTATQEDFNAVLDAANSASFDGIAGVSAFISAIQKLMNQAIATTGAVATMNATIRQGANAALNDPRTWRGAGNAAANADGTIQNESNPLPFGGPTPQARPPIELEGLPGQFKADGSLAGSGHKGGGGSGAGKLKTELEGINQALQNLNEPFAQATTAYNTLQTAMKNGTIDNDAYTESLKQIQDAFIASGGTSDQWAKIVEGNSKKVSSSIDDAKSVFKGFVSDFMSGIRQGKGIWESFANAANNALDKIIDKLLNNLIDAIFTVNKTASGATAGGGKGGGGLLGGIISLFGGLFSAKGNVFGRTGVQAFANGGVVDKTTAFAYGSGSVGVMGEAGPEAIIPLKRGRDGSLGVQMHSASSGATQNNVTIAPVIQTQSTGNDAQDQKNATRVSDAVTDAITKIVDQRILIQSSYGGALKPRGYQGKS